MKVNKVELKDVKRSEIIRDNEVEVHLHVHNGFNNLNVTLSKKNLQFNDIVNYDVDVKVIFYARNCCRAAPMLIMDSANEKDKVEIKELIDNILKIKGDEIKAAIEVA
ncbi:hypothetical protein SAMN02745196_01612 [Clostridium collagenovorans DSM 3089]|uniref:Uncharacterized protein n=1 Tax=Clostridium collagenovorans DSM 3089 TaxID=1121306 RepID=A0A1M5W989_9CLOT|nr:hypothetical protein [Clostridium collagenovorans]SHH83763.1 hypothetical protein SAMN02745196_01612 [Clostridium collagenovorans DSM 3089]